ncbi:MAG TPA: DUF1552 domain-containing protein [Polyangia bacterium]|nr:DUF1552 domain-containing protein [Polyangia bacterium]
MKSARDSIGQHALAVKADASPKIRRRLFLGGGAAVAIGLPFLESLAPRSARADAPVAPKRTVFYYVPCGINGSTRGDFYPTTTGPGFEITTMLEPLAALKPDFTFITGLENALAKPDGPGDHASGTGAFITCAHPFKSEETIMNGVSADQIAAQKVGTATRLPSMQLGIDGGSSAGGCDSGYSCAYARNVSWADAMTPLPKLTNPSQVFDQIFMGFDPTASTAELAKRRAYQKSVLDSALDDATTLRGKLGKTDGEKLDQFLTGVRELERQAAVATPTAMCTMPTTKTASSTDFETQVKAMSDLMVLAMQCDSTRIISFMLGNAGSNRTYNNLGISRGHHDISHHGMMPANLMMLQQIGTYEIQLFAYFLTKLKAVPEGANDMLYNSTIFFSSEISDGDRHNHDDMPVILAGHGGGMFTPGKHLLFPTATHTKVSNLLTSVIATMGVNVKVGDADGTLAGL